MLQVLNEIKYIRYVVDSLVYGHQSKILHVWVGDVVHLGEYLFSMLETLDMMTNNA